MRARSRTATERESKSPEREESPARVHLPFETRSTALTVLCCLGLVFALDWGHKFFIPLFLGILIAYTLNPLVNGLEKIRLPRWLGATIVTAGTVCVLALGSYSLRDEMQTIVEQLPTAARKVSASVGDALGDTHGNLQKVQSAARELERATTRAAGTPPAAGESAQHVVVDEPPFRLVNLLWQGSMGAVLFVVQAAMVLFLVFFLLVSGDTFKRKLVRITGPSLSRRRITLEIVEEINSSVQRYMLMLLVTNTLVGMLTWVALRLIGLQNAEAWAVAAGLLHVVPYLGPSVTAVALGLASFLQFSSLTMALIAMAASLTIAILIGVFVTTWMTGRIARMNAPAVFISLLFWGWLWGVWGMLLAVPLIVITKVASEHVEQFRPLAELLGE